jgi:hypothetical protein
VCGRKSGRDCIDAHASGRAMTHASYNLERKPARESEEAPAASYSPVTPEPPSEPAPRRMRRKRRCADGSDHESSDAK